MFDFLKSRKLFEAKAPITFSSTRESKIPATVEYRFLVCNSTFDLAKDYLNKLIAGGVKPGYFLSCELAGVDLQSLEIDRFLDLLINTKKPQIFAEKSVLGDGGDWNHDEMTILGNVMISVPVKAYDNGIHYNPQVHRVPIDSTLIFVPGALFESGTSTLPADFEYVCHKGFVYDRYLALYRKRLIPVFKYINEAAARNKKKAFITIPGIGCGHFAGPYKHQLEDYFEQIIYDILHELSPALNCIDTIYYDPFRRSANKDLKVDNIKVFTRPLMLQKSYDKGQLSKPSDLIGGSDVDDYDLYSLVAWDHVSWPGNDFFIGNRETDDGVKSAATNCMYKLTGIEGTYRVAHNKYQPPEKFATWKQVIDYHKLRLSVECNINRYDDK